jgi:2-polyprenyl-6-hydroxyphenyl methylase/3-demethylubiquinone-9 3-methyltransferase
MSQAPFFSETSSLNPEEVERFNALANTWWDTTGSMGMLHKLNPARLLFIRDTICAHFNRNPKMPRPYSGLDILDVGCGGGIVCEPMARLGALVTGIDPAEDNITVAQNHANAQQLSITYLPVTVETLTQEQAQFDVVLALEVIEHVANPEHFVQACAQVLKPNGIMIIATLNRTSASFALAIVGAEYILGWLPKGTHSWSAFVTPDELTTWLSGAALLPKSETGMVYHPLADRWKLSSNMQVNYMMSAVKT